MSEQTAVVDLLKALLSSEGEAVTYGGGSGAVYHRPTITNLVTEPGGAMIGQRADHRISFSFTESDGTRVSYGGVVSQDDLFRALWNAGLLARSER